MHLRQLAVVCAAKWVHISAAVHHMGSTRQPCCTPARTHAPCHKVQQSVREKAPQTCPTRAPAEVVHAQHRQARVRLRLREVQQHHQPPHPLLARHRLDGEREVGEHAHAVGHALDAVLRDGLLLRGQYLKRGNGRVGGGGEWASGK